MTTLETHEERRQAAYYDAIAGRYDAHYGSPSALAYRSWVYDRVLADLPLAGTVALDAMCGGGEATAYLRARGAEVVGLDISRECCAIYRERYPQGQVVCASILDSELPDARFDVVVTDSLHHLHPRVDEGMAEIHRVLKPGGHFCFWEPSADSLVDRLRRLWYRLDPKFFEDNERSIDAAALAGAHRERFRTLATVHGGNLAYLLVNGSMALRIPPRLVRIYAPALLGLERTLTPLQPRFLSLWVLCLMQKIEAP